MTTMQRVKDSKYHPVMYKLGKRSSVVNAVSEDDACVQQLYIINTPFGGTMVVLQFIRTLAVLAFLLLAHAYAAPTVYVGHIDGSDAQVALLVENGQVLGYACGGNATWSTHSSWFPANTESVLGDSTFTLTGANGHVLQGLFSAEAAEGTLTLPDGTDFAWSATVAAENTPAGLYLLNEKSDDVEDLIGFIVANDLQTVGNIRHILPRSSSTTFGPVGLAEALPENTPESLTVCFTLESEVSCKELPRASSTQL
jgi:hypothetical protein